jgi:hypothetical protein
LIAVTLRPARPAGLDQTLDSTVIARELGPDTALQLLELAAAELPERREQPPAQH